MTPADGWPLASLLELRRSEEDAAARALADAGRARVEAEARRDRAGATEAVTRARLADARRDADGLAVSGAATAGELGARDALRRRLGVELAAAVAGVAEAEAGVRAGTEAEARARDALAARIRARKVLEGEEAAWRRERAGAAERRAEAEADDRGPGRGGRGA